MYVFFTDIIKRNKSIFIKMAYISDFKRVQSIGARMAGVSVTKTAELFAVARCTVSKVMTAFEKEGKNLPTQAKLWKKAKDVL